MKKSELEADANAYALLMATAHNMERRGEYRAAVTTSASAWSNVAGMIRFTSRYEERVTQDVTAIDLVAKYAPLLLDYRTVNALEAFVTSERRLLKQTSCTPEDLIREVRKILWEAHYLWGYLADAGEVGQAELIGRIGGDPPRWHRLLTDWEKMGVVERASDGRHFKVVLATRLGSVIRAKCPKCGNIAEAPKSMFLEVQKCLQCFDSVEFVLCNVSNF